MIDRVAALRSGSAHFVGRNERFEKLSSEIFADQGSEVHLSSATLSGTSEDDGQQMSQKMVDRVDPDTERSEFVTLLRSCHLSFDFQG